MWSDLKEDVETWFFFSSILFQNIDILKAWLHVNNTVWAYAASRATLSSSPISLIYSAVQILKWQFRMMVILELLLDAIDDMWYSNSTQRIHSFINCPPSAGTSGVRVQVNMLFRTIAFKGGIILILKCAFSILKLQWVTWWKWK